MDHTAKSMLNFLSRAELGKLVKKNNLVVTKQGKDEQIDEIVQQLKKPEIEQIKDIITQKILSRRNSFYVFRLGAKGHEIFSLAENLELYSKNNKNKQTFSKTHKTDNKVAGKFSYVDTDFFILPGGELGQSTKEISLTFEINFINLKIYVWTSSIDRFMIFKRALKLAGVSFSSMDRYKLVSRLEKMALVGRLNISAKNYIAGLEKDA